MNCTNNGVCIDKIGTKAAYCNCSGTGYQGNFCEIDECTILLNHGGCDTRATCTNNKNGTFHCSCNIGYFGDGINCVGMTFDFDFFFFFFF